ncbi:MAG: hypothetical protein MK212_01845 [Saprospiraceae bacterium]|nr:hypothetical protein [Saprospiraceae bacterium]
MALLDDNSRFVKSRMDTKQIGIVHFVHLIILFAVLALGFYLNKYHKGFFGDWKILAYLLPFLLLGAGVYTIRLKVPFLIGLILSSLIVVFNLILALLVLLDWCDLPALLSLQGDAQYYFIFGCYAFSYALSVELFVYLKYRKIINL